LYPPRNFSPSAKTLFTHIIANIAFNRQVRPQSPKAINLLHLRVKQSEMQWVISGIRAPTFAFSWIQFLPGNLSEAPGDLEHLLQFPRVG